MSMFNSVIKSFTMGQGVGWECLCYILLLIVLERKAEVFNTFFASVFNYKAFCLDTQPLEL